MGVNGMKRNKEVIKMESKVKVSLKILPFGSIRYKIGGFEHSVEEKESEISKYTEPLTTHIEKVEICYEEGETYSVPRTTSGM